MIRRLAVIGVGLIGGSLARAMRTHGFVNEIVGCARSAETLKQARQLGVIDRGTDDARQAVAGADLVVLAVPVRATGAILARIAPVLAPNAVITDVGSVKAHVVAEARVAMGPAFPRFVPGHPIAGTERSGVEASFATLFNGRRVIVTPVSDTDPGALELVRDTWRRIGAEVIEMDVDRHDALLALTSHLPHVLAYALVQCIAHHPDSKVLFDLAAGGFYDFTRIASSDPDMWRDICLTNSDNVAKALALFEKDMGAMRDAIAGLDGERLLQWFGEAKNARDGALAQKKK